MEVLSLMAAWAAMILQPVRLAGYLGRLGTLEAIILIAGVLLLVIEMFVPGFGIAGGTGVILLVIGIAMTAGSPLEAFALILILILLITILMMVMLRSARKGRIARNIVLQMSTSRDRGYRSTENAAHLAGTEGTALSELRPAGVAEFGGKRYDVVTEGIFIPRGARITVIDVIGRRIVVAPSAAPGPAAPTESSKPS